MTKSRFAVRMLAAPILATIVGLAAGGPVLAAGGDIKIDRQQWSFSGIFGKYDQAQLQRGFQVYKEVCAACHELKRIAFRNLAEPGGPQFPEEAVKALAAEYEVAGEPNDDGEATTRPGILADRFPPLYANEKAARSTHNGALPPDLSVMTKARAVAYVGPWYLHPAAMMQDMVMGYQEGGVDYMYALLTGYKEEPPAGVKLGDGMHYNSYYPGHQIAMAPPLSDGVVEYSDGTPGTLSNYAKDVSAFLAWSADPKLNQRKELGWRVMLYLLITVILLYISKRRIWAGTKH